MSRSKAHQVGYPVASRSGPRTWLHVTLYPTDTSTRCAVRRRGSPSDGPDGTPLAACHLDVTRADLAGLSTRAILFLYGAALTAAIPSYDWRTVGCPPGPPQLYVQEELDFA